MALSICPACGTRLRNPKNLWTEKDVDSLVRLWEKGISYTKIGRVLKRTPEACRQRVYREDLNRRAL